jgi:hypothetical protein
VYVKVGPAFTPSDLHDRSSVLRTLGPKGETPELHAFDNLHGIASVVESRFQELICAFSSEKWTDFKAQLADFHQQEQDRAFHLFADQGIGG